MASTDVFYGCNDIHRPSLDPRLDQALNEVDRDRFIHHDDKSLIVGHSLPPKETLKQWLQYIHLPDEARVLHIGCGSGYITAVLAKLASQLTAVDRLEPLVKVTRANMKALGLNQVRVLRGEGGIGVPHFAPYDLIFISTPKVEKKLHLLEQLTPKGALFTLECADCSKDILVRYIRDPDGGFIRTELGLLDFHHHGDEVLIEMGIVDLDCLKEARRLATKHHTRVIDEVRKLKCLDDLSFYQSLSSQCGLPLGQVEKLLQQVNIDLFGRFSKSFLDHQQIIPLYIEGDQLLLATTDPDAPVNDVQEVFPQLSVQKVLVTPTDYRRLWSAIELCRQSRMKAGLQPIAEVQSKEPEDLLAKEKPEIEAHLISVFEALLLDAVAQRASDIHIEQYGERVRMRLRVDGELHDVWHYDLTPRDLRGLINVIKLRAELNIAERRLPQGGRARLRVGIVEYDLRIQIQPSLYGEHAIIRLLPQNEELLAIEKLGLSPPVAASYKRLLRHPAGLVLVVGPTGSGKSTTLYAGLQLLAADATRKIITVEDPIEYSIENIQQVRIRPEINFNFADAMRSFVREDPDVILVGEIRDHETALEAVRASQTGHVVLSTLHCNDAVDAMQRLYDLGVHPNSLASELLAVMAQRLAKKICPRCRHQVEPDESILAELFPSGTPDSFCCFEGKGCDHCQYRGTVGRVAVVEYLRVNSDIRNAISRQIPVGELRKLALDCGLVTMRDSALDHVIQGNIPLSELPRILPADRMAPEARWQWEPTV